MSSKSPDYQQQVVAIGEQTYLFETPLTKPHIARRSGARRAVDLQLQGRTYCALQLDADDCGDLKSVPLQNHSQLASISGDFSEFISELLSANEGVFEMIRSDASAIRALAKLWAAPVPVNTSISAYRVKGVDIAILVVPRNTAAAIESVACAGTATHHESLRIVQTGRYLAATKPHLRLVAIDMGTELRADEICLLGRHAASVFALTTIFFDSIEDFYHHCSRHDPDILQMLYQCCKPAHAVISRLLAREKTAAAVSDPRWGFYLEFDTACQLANGFFLSGWYLDPEDRLLEAALFDHRLDQPDIVDRWTLKDEVLEREGSRELAKRFRIFVPATLHGNSSVVRICVKLRGGVNLLLACPNHTNSQIKHRDAVLATIVDHSFSRDLFENVYAPALLPLQQTLNERQAIRHRHEFGHRSKRGASIIIPLYSQLGFIRSQLMAFVRDPFVRSVCQILYVLDDPALTREARSLLQAYQLWASLDISLLELTRNGGFALANNMAFEAVEGQCAILLNSDVIPVKPGWIETALRALENTPPFSVIGPKLLYADDSLQHAGMLFRRFPHGFWQNLHYWKGFGRDYHKATQQRTVPAVTGACMILRSSDYRAVGGFTQDYIHGDYEDSDLCLKLRQRGGQCIYLPDIELYHFERQSMPSIADGHDRRSTIYNRALHSHRWDDAITALMSEFA